MTKQEELKEALLNWLTDFDAREEVGIDLASLMCVLAEHGVCLKTESSGFMLGRILIDKELLNEKGWYKVVPIEDRESG